MTDENWDEFSSRYRLASESLDFYACIDRDGKWFDSSSSFSTAMHWCRYYAGDFATQYGDERWMTEDGVKLGYSIVHGSMLKKMWEQRLVS